MRGLSLALGQSILRALHSNSGPRLPRNGLLLYLARPNSDEYLVGEDTEIGEDTYIWGYVLPDDADIRAATGWVNGAANVFYTATGVPIVALATEIAAAIDNLPLEVVFSIVNATAQIGRLAIYAPGTSDTILARAYAVLRYELALPSSGLLLNAGPTPETIGATTVLRSTIPANANTTVPQVKGSGFAGAGSATVTGLLTTDTITATGDTPTCSVDGTLTFPGPDCWDVYVYRGGELWAYWPGINVGNTTELDASGNGHHLVALTTTTITERVDGSGTKYTNIAGYSEYGSIVFLGDSITVGGFPTTTGSLLGGATVVNAGVSGDRLSMMSARFDTDVASVDYSGGLHVLGGVNDIYDGVDLPTLITRATTIINQAVALDISPIVFSKITPAAAFAGWTPAMQVVLEGFNEWLEANPSIITTESFDALVLGDGETMQAAYTSDGLHPNAAGHLVLGAAIANGFIKRIPDYPGPLRRDLVVVPTTVSNNVRLQTLTDMLESGDETAGWIYTTNTTTTSCVAQNPTATIVADGAFQSVVTSLEAVVLGLVLTPNGITSYTGLGWAIFPHSGGYYRVLESGGAVTANVNALVEVIIGDKMQLRRVGEDIYAEVIRADGTVVRVHDAVQASMSTLYPIITGVNISGVTFGPVKVITGAMGTTYPNLTVTAPLGPEFQGIAEWTGGAAVDLATLTPTANTRKGQRGIAVWSPGLDAAEIVRADKVLGA